MARGDARASVKVGGRYHALNGPGNPCMGYAWQMC
jgi:hypothetical protein